MPSPEKLKADLDRSASQFGQLPVAVREHMTLVTGPADIHELTKEILDFCGALPIYKTENSLSPIREENGVLTLIQEPTRRKRRQIPSNFTSCLQSVSQGVDHPLKYVKEGGCITAPDTWKLLCQLKRLDRDCHYFVQCTRDPTVPQHLESHGWNCEKQHLFGNTLYSYCCDPICPSSNGRK